MELKLDDLIGKEPADRMIKKGHDLNPKAPYDRKNFVEYLKNFDDLEQRYAKVRENSNDVVALNDLAKTLTYYVPGDDRTNRQTWLTSPIIALEDSDYWQDKASRSIAKFTKNKKNEIFDKLSDRQLYSIFGRVPLYESYDKPHEIIRQLREKHNSIAQARKENIPVVAVLQDDIRERIEKASEDVQEFIARNQERMYNSIGTALVNAIERNYRNAFMVEAGEGKDKRRVLDKKAIRTFLEDNIELAEDAMKEIPKDSEDELDDFWKDNVVPLYVEMSRELHRSEKKDQKKDDNPKKEERKDKFKKRGFRI